MELLVLIHWVPLEASAAQLGNVSYSGDLTDHVTHLCTVTAFPRTAKLACARRLGLPFWVVLGEGAYDRPITAPVKEVVALVSALLWRRAAA